MEANKSGKAYQKQRNPVLKLNRKAKKNFLKSCISTNDEMKNKNFLDALQTLFYRRVRNTTKIL